MWTATLILELVAAGKMRLDDTVAHWLPGLLPYGNQITVSQLLSMTSGMVDTSDFVSNPAHYLSKIKDAPWCAPGRLADACNVRPRHLTQAWIAVAAALPLSTRPGRRGTTRTSATWSPG